MAKKRIRGVTNHELRAGKIYADEINANELYVINEDGSKTHVGTLDTSTFATLVQVEEYAAKVTVGNDFPTIGIASKHIHLDSDEKRMYFRDNDVWKPISNPIVQRQVEAGTPHIVLIGDRSSVRRISFDVDVINPEGTSQNSYSFVFIIPFTGEIPTPRAIIDLEQHTHCTYESFVITESNGEISVQMNSTGTGTLNIITSRFDVSSI